jgi:hypothetical protein
MSMSVLLNRRIARNLQEILKEKHLLLKLTIHTLILRSCEKKKQIKYSTI